MSIDINTSRSAISKDLGATVISGHFLVYNEKKQKNLVYEAVKSLFSHLEIFLCLKWFENTYYYVTGEISFLDLFLYIDIKSIPWSFYNSFVIGELII